MEAASVLSSVQTWHQHVAWLNQSQVDNQDRSTWVPTWHEDVSSHSSDLTSRLHMGIQTYSTLTDVAMLLSTSESDNSVDLQICPGCVHTCSLVIQSHSITRREPGLRLGTLKTKSFSKNGLCSSTRYMRFINRTTLECILNICEVKPKWC